MAGQTQFIGTIPEFITDYDDWNVYSERLEQFFEVNDIVPEKRSAFLISCIGSQAYKCLRDLCHPALPKDKPFEVLCELLRKQFSPQVAIYRERTTFYNARQESFENVTQWYGRLKKLSVDCRFGDCLESILLDKFVTGLRPGQVLDRLCEENETIELSQALDIAMNKECAVRENAYLPQYDPSNGLPGQIPPGICGTRLAICPPRLPSDAGSGCSDAFECAAQAVEMDSAPMPLAVAMRAKGRPRNRRRKKAGLAAGADNDGSQAGGE